MSRQLIGRALVRLYPGEVQRARGNELLGTLLDAGEASWWSFVSNGMSVAVSGLLARAREELGRSVWQIAVGALCWAAVLIAMRDVVQGICMGLYWGGSIFVFGHDSETIIDMYVLPVLILALFSTGRTRTVGALGLLRVAMRLHQSPLIGLAGFMILVPVQVLGFGLLATRPRSFPRAGRYLWPIPAVMWAFYWLTLLGQHSGVGKLTPVIAAVALLPFAPSMALGLGIDWLLMGVGYLTYPGGDGFPLWTVELLACLPVVLLLTAGFRLATKPTADTL